MPHELPLTETSNLNGSWIDAKIKAKIVELASRLEDPFYLYDTKQIKDVCAPFCVLGATEPGGICDDGNACTTDTCDEGNDACIHTPVTCDDGDTCTTDTYDPATGCVFAPIDCDDGNACTTDSCDPAVGCVHDAVECEDANPCTDDTCDPASGCVYVNNTAPCDDGNVCTTNDACANGACCSGRFPSRKRRTSLLPSPGEHKVWRFGNRSCARRVLQPWCGV